MPEQILPGRQVIAFILGRRSSTRSVGTRDVSSRVSLAFLMTVLFSSALACGGQEVAQPATRDLDVPLRLSPVAVEGAAGAWALFDRDTTTTWAPGEEPVELFFGAPKEVHEVRVFAAGEVRVKLESDDGWELTVELEPTGGWATLALEEPRQIESVRMFALDPSSSGAIAEVELWSRRPLSFGALRQSHLRARYERPLEDAVIPHQLDVADASPSFAVLGGPEGGSRCAVFSLELPRPAAAYRRVFVGYRTQGVFRPFALSRSVNDATSREGVLLIEGGEPSIVLEPLDPSTLEHGANSLRFCLPADAAQPAVLQRVRVFAELDDGMVLVDEEEGPPALAEVTEEEGLYLPFTRLVEPRRILLTEASTMAWELSCFDANGDPQELHARAVIGAPGTIAFEPHASVSCEAIALQPRSPTARVGSVQVFGSPTHRRTDWPRIAVTSAPEHFGRVAWVEGWLDDVTGAPWLANLTVNGESVSMVGGGFATLIERVDDSAPDWPVVLTATFPDGEIVVRRMTLSLTDALDLSGWDPGTGSSEENAAAAQEAAQFGPEGGSASSAATPETGGEIWLGSRVGVSVPPGAVDRPTDITVIHVGSELLPRLDPGMVNVTAPRGHGYEMLPHGQRFAVPIEVIVPFDPALIPAGQTPEDVHTFYYEPRAKEWRKLQRARVVEESSVVRSLTDHFTLMINATVIAPEHPELATFNPTQIKDIQAANPAARVNLVAPPSANSQGDARLSYPIEVPPGRHGMQPDLSISYSSGNSNGWLGVGWDLHVPSITVDTRWGVPRYDPNVETETYLLDGQQLTPLAHRDVPVERNRGAPAPNCKRFHARVEGAFARIERCGFSPSGYFWKVTDKNGRELIFGNDRIATEWDVNALLTTAPDRPDGNIFRWPLRRITDANGNRIDLSYRVLRDSGTTGSVFPVMGHDLYLENIRYTGNRLFRGLYEIRFLVDPDEDRRPDPIIDARGGFKRVTAKRLRRVEVLFDDQQVRAYELEYQIGAFGKSLLRSIQQLGPNDEPFPGDAHRFEYFDEVSGVDAEGRPVVNGFASTQDLGVLSDGVVLAEGWPSESSSTALNGSDIRAGGGSLYLGVAVPGLGKSLSAGMQLSVGGESSRAHLELVDVDADGRPDKVFESDGRLFFRKNVSRAGGNLAFSEETIEMEAVGPLAVQLRLSETESGNLSVTQQAHVLDGVASASLGVGVSSTQARTYFSDVNADGVPDLVDRGLVLFGRVAPDGQVTFGTSSDGTFMPLGPSFGCADEALLTGQQHISDLIEALIDGVDLTVPLPDELAPLVDFVPTLEDGIGGPVSDFLEVRDGTVVTGAPVDTVQRWESPFDGTVSISGAVTLSPDSDGCAGSDGVRVAIEHGTGDPYASEPTSAVSELWSKELTLDDPSAAPSGVSQVEVHKGDRLYFRVGSVFDGECDIVRWDPEITYDGGEVIDANGLDAHSYRASADFTLAGARGTLLDLPLAGTVALEGTLSKLAATSDDVELTITLEHTDPLTGLVTGAEEVETVSLAASVTDDVDVGWSGEVLLGDRLRAHIKVRSPIDVRQLSWVPRVIYTSVDDESVDVDAVPSLFLPYDVDVYPRIKNDGPEETWVVPHYDSDTIKLSPRVGGSFQAGGSLTFSVKRREELVAQSTVFVGLGLQLPASGELVLALEEDDELFVELSTTDPALFDHITSFSAKAKYKDGDEEVEIDIPISLYGASRDSLFSGTYRGWANAGYRAAGARGTDPLEELDFIPKDSATSDPGLQPAFAFTPSFDFGEDRELWRGPTGRSWVAAGGLSSSRTGGVVHLGPQVANGTCIAPPRLSATLQYTANGSLVVGGGGHAVGLTASLLDYLDMNGDGFPDIAGFGFLQLTDPRGGLFPQGVRFAPLQVVPVRFGLAASGTLSLGPGMRQARIQVNAAGRSDASTRGPLANGWSGSLEGAGNLLEVRGGIDAGLSVGTADLIDINGDGLPDRVTVDRVGVFVPVLDPWNVDLTNIGNVLDGIAEASELFLLGVELNLGDGRFGGHERWGPGLMSFGTNVGAGVSAGASLPTPVGIGGQVALAFRGSGANSALLDMNGDGLVDLVQPFGDGALRVAFNTGAGFTEALPWTGAQQWDWSDVAEDGSAADQLIPEAAHDKTVAFQAGGQLTASGIPVPCPCPPAGFVPIGVASIGVSAGVSAGLQQVAIRDIDGDGYPDDLLSEEEGMLHVALNRTGRTNLLRTIQRPLYGRIELDYARSGNTLLQPQNRWVLSRVEVSDGLAHDWQDVEGQRGADFQVASFEYENGLYDRFEREFLGFAKVAETQHDTTGLEQTDLSSALPYRRIVRTYGTFPDDDAERCDLPDSDMRKRYCGRPFAGKGLLVSERVEEVQGSGPARLFTSTFNIYSFKDAHTGQRVADASSATASLFPALEEVERRVYEGGSAPIVTNLRQQYDRFGNVVRYVDTGDLGAADNVMARITYSERIPGCAERHIVGKPDSIVVVDSSGRELLHRNADIDCATGNTTELRAHVAGGVATTTLGYGFHGNLTSVTGPENENSERYRLDFDYDDETGTYVTAIRDSFGYESLADYDLRFGEVKSTTDSNGNVITNTYDAFGRLEKVVGPYEAGAYEYTLTFDYHPDAEVPFAHTRHMDPQRDPGDPIETILFIDGLGRVIQTKKDATVHASEDQPPRDVMIVSGRVAFDHAGRVRAQYYPTTEDKGTNNTSFSSSFEEGAPPPTRTTYDALDRATSVTLPDGTVTSMTYTLAEDGGRRRLSTLIRDANGNERQTLRDVRGLVTAVHEQGGSPIVTRYAHDPLQRLTHITDDAGNVTTIEYDRLGRRTAIDNPDTGRIKLEWDLAGNLTRKVTPTLRAQGQVIRYGYRFNRLEHIFYPSHPENNVTYEYGRPEERGEPGNRAGRLKRIVDASGLQERLYGRLGEVIEERRTINHTSGDPATYVTSYHFDTWGRLHSMTYPDGEVLTYTYDSGGLVSSVRGVKDRFEYPYLVRIEHDAFEQRAFMETGTGIKTTYRYDPTDRRLEELASGDFQKLSYFYDDVGNITDLVNDAAPSGRFGGPSNQHFDYDSLYRLTTATGELRTNDSHVHNYELSLGYDDIHNILQKDQTHRRTTPDGAVKVQRGATYNHSYQYTGPKPHAPSHIGERTYAYDANGNQAGWLETSSNQRRSISWDEENRIRHIEDNGRMTSFVYDDAGERVLKVGRGETAYVNQHFTVRSRNQKTKHVWVGTSRIVSKLVPGDDTLDDEEDGDGEEDEPAICDPFHTHGNGHVAGHTHGRGHEAYHCHGEEDGTEEPLPPEEEEPPPCALEDEPDEKNFVYFFHPDHLGSTSFVTDCRGEVYRHIAYFPFGETWVEQSSETNRISHLYTGKEFDEETGLYYYGARYYDPRASVWQSPDPLVVFGIDTSVATPSFMNAYIYVRQNPLRLIDPTGLAEEEAQPGRWEKWKKSYEQLSWTELKEGLKQRAYFWAAEKTEAAERSLLREDSYGDQGVEGGGGKEGLGEHAGESASTMTGGAIAVAEDVAISKGASGFFKRLFGSTSRTKLLPPGLSIPTGNAKSGMEHILRRHAFNTTTTKSASKFSQGMGHMEIRSLIQEANARSSAWRIEGGSRVLDVDMGRSIGTDLSGNSTSALRVVTDLSGSVITAYPIP